MNKKYLVNIRFVDMLLEMVMFLRIGARYPTYYWKSENGYVEIVECDLMRGRIVMADGDFSEFEWEMEESHIYREEVE